LPTRYISPAGSGTKDGSSWDNAAPLASLSKLIDVAGPGGEVLLRADQGAYHLSDPVFVQAGGAANAPVTIRGVDASGAARSAEFIGTRAANWQPGLSEGQEAFRLLDGANHLTFENLSFQNIGNGAFRAGSDLSDLTIEHVTATNVGRLVENYVSGAATSASIDGLTVRDVDIQGFSGAGAIRLQYDTRNVLLEDVVGDSQHQNGGLYVNGVVLDDTVHDVVLRQVTMKNSYGKGGPDDYWNGDGFTTERGVYNVRFEDTLASGNTDSGYDLKSSNTILVRAVAEDNTRNYKLWSDSITLQDSVSLNPDAKGGVNVQGHIQLTDGARVTMTGGQVRDADPATTVFDLWKPGAHLEVSGTVVSVHPDARLSGLGSGSTLNLLPADSAAAAEAASAGGVQPADTALSAYEALVTDDALLTYEDAAVDGALPADDTITDSAPALSAFGTNADGWSSDDLLPGQVADASSDGATDAAGLATSGAYSPHSDWLL
jgi:hypothetical protein